MQYEIWSPLVSYLKCGFCCFPVSHPAGKGLCTGTDEQTRYMCEAETKPGSIFEEI